MEFPSPEDGLLHMADFHGVQRFHLEDANRFLSASWKQGNITVQVQSVEFVVPVRKVIIEDKAELYVCLGESAKPNDPFFRVRIEPALEYEEIPGRG